MPTIRQWCIYIIKERAIMPEQQTRKKPGYLGEESTMEKMYRVAISDWSPYCDSCRVYPGEKIVGDYCPHCQYTYNSLTEVREYADATIAWCESAEEAAAIEASLVPYRIIII